MFLSFFGIASIGLSCLVALFLYHVVFGIQYLGILNGVAAFVIVGIGELSPSHVRGLPLENSIKKVFWVMVRVVRRRSTLEEGWVGPENLMDGALTQSVWPRSLVGGAWRQWVGPRRMVGNSWPQWVRLGVAG